MDKNMGRSSVVLPLPVSPSLAATQPSSLESGVGHPTSRRGSRRGIHATKPSDTINEHAVQPFDFAGAPKLIRFAAVQERVSMGRTAVYELIKAGKFPRPVKVGTASAWIDVEITRWIEQLAEKRDASA